MTKYIRVICLVRIDKMKASGIDKSICEKYQKEANSPFIAIITQRLETTFVNRIFSKMLGIILKIS